MKNQVVVVVGASGGLGSAIAKAFSAKDTQVLLAGRTRQPLEILAAQIGHSASIFTADITDIDSLDALRQHCLTVYGHVDVVVNATGYDVRKPFSQHELTEVNQLIDVNLLGAILLTRAFLPLLTAQNAGTIIHLGGFADGRLAFPYYSVDVATRAGLRTFLESINRELSDTGVRTIYFSPTTADTAAEHPYQDLWREIGVSMVSPETVAQSLLRTLERRQPVYIMGRGSRLLSGLNAICPQLADRLLLNRYDVILKRYLAA